MLKKSAYIQLVTLSLSICFSEFWMPNNRLDWLLAKKRENYEESYAEYEEFLLIDCSQVPKKSSINNPHNQLIYKIFLSGKIGYSPFLKAVN